MLLLAALLPAATQAQTQTAGCAPLSLRHTFDDEQLWSDLRTLAADTLQGRKTGTPGSVKTQQFLQQTFAQIGLNAFTPDYRQPFRHAHWLKDTHGTNMLGWLPGTTQPQQYIVITAHYDHLGKFGRVIYNGADDNASGVAAMLTLARAVKRQPLHHSVIFVATDAEELGLYGATAFLQQPPVPIDHIRYHINLDMLAYPGKKRQLYVADGHANEAQNRVLSEVVRQSMAQASLCLLSGHDKVSRSHDRQHRINWPKASDHYSFGQRGIAYLFFSDNDHQYYHSEKDTIDKLDRRFYTAAVETIFTALKILDRQ